MWKSLGALQKQGNIHYKKVLALLLLIHQLSNIYKIGKKILPYRKYVCNLSQSDFDLFPDYIYAKIVTVSIIDTKFLDY